MKLIKSLPLLLLLMGCAGRNPVNIERPNARTPLEEKTYNLLKSSMTLIETAKECDVNPDDGCEVADFVRPILAVMETVHNEALAASLIYVAFLDAGDSPSADSVQNLEDLILSLEKQITRFITGGGGE